MENKYIMLAYAMACIQMDDERVRVHSDQGMTMPKDAFASFCVEFDPSDKEFLLKVESADKFIKSEMDHMYVEFDATLYKGERVHTLQPDSIEEWNENLGKFNDCERVTVRILKKTH